MRARDLLSGAPLIALGMFLARVLPRRLGYWIARRIARGMAARRSRLFRVLCANLGRVVGPTVSTQELEALAESAIYHAGRTYVDMFRASVDGLRRGRIPVRVDAQAWASVRQAFQDGRGAILVAPHMSNFDLAIQWVAAQGIVLCGLGLPNPTPGVRLMNWLRARRGTPVMPVSVGAVRSAIKWLKEGKVVFTGVDRPIFPDDEPILFFGAPARLPTGYVRLALQTEARVVAACCVQDPDDVYRIIFSPPLEFERTGRLDEDVRRGARQVLRYLEQYIRAAPDQWLMFVPVWDNA